MPKLLIKTLRGLFLLLTRTGSLILSKSNYGVLPFRVSCLARLVLLACDASESLHAQTFNKDPAGSFLLQTRTGSLILSKSNYGVLPFRASCLARLALLACDASESLHAHFLCTKCHKFLAA